MDWPAESPDLNPIENVWGLMATKIQASRPKSFEEFKMMIQNEWEHISTKNVWKMMKAYHIGFKSVLSIVGIQLDTEVIVILKK